MSLSCHSRPFLWSFPSPILLAPHGRTLPPDSFSSLPSLSHCLLFFHQITFRIFRAGQRVILVYPGTFTAVLYWVSFQWDSSFLSHSSEMQDFLWVSLILFKGRSDPVEVALLPLLVSYRPFQPIDLHQEMPLIWTKLWLISPLLLSILGVYF